MAYPYRPSGGDSGGNADVAGNTAGATTPLAAAQIGSEGRSAAPAANAVGFDSEAIATNRKKYLLDLVPDLSLDEIWMLQKRLATLDLRTDIVSRLPPELQMLVADDLGPSDLGCCLQVSRKWRDALLHKSMLKKLARRCFPSLLEYIDVVYKKEARAETVTESSSLDTLVANIFTDTAKQYALRAQGHFSYVFRHCKDPPARLAVDCVAANTTNLGAGKAEAASVNEDTSSRPPHRSLTWLNTERETSDRPKREAPVSLPLYPPPDLLANGEEDIWSSDDEDDSGLETYMGPDYAYGRLAWQSISISYVSFIVDDLRTGRRAVFKVMNSTVRGRAHLLCAFGDQLLISSAGTSILAWDFTTGETHTKTIPAQMDTVATLGNAVYILSQGDIFVWKIGGPVRDVDMTGFDARFRQPDRDGRLPSYFLLDPLDRDVFYLGNYEVNGGANGLSGELCVHVHKFKDLKYSETFTHGLPFSNFAFPSRIIGTNARRDSRGLFSVATWRADKGTPGSKQTSTLAVLDRIGSLSFNIYTHKFVVSFYPLPPQSPTIGPDHFHTINTHLWNNQLITLVDRYRDAPGSKIRVAKPLLLAFEDEGGEEARCLADVPFSGMPLYISAALAQHQYRKNTPPPILESPAMIKPELRKRIRFHEINPGTAAQWQQSDEDWAKTGCILRFGLDVVTLRKGKEDRPTHIRQYSLEGDDEFLIMHYNNEYTVWCFNDSLDPTGWAAFDEAGE
ncbi:hypothetical protein F503_00351 [Ophiostoma piceae UAMH 11346]|uniref:F-box domain-containing protein n=1 Tax=Ophiostoma piceae (strain UAMH 11346) TaxID=1262450 RepID=S3C274_OPHP1|nr:hypothetical protein F503_00351 [Ophiostoma piceae UAMH 11346]